MRLRSRVGPCLSALLLLASCSPLPIGIVPTVTRASASTSGASVSPQPLGTALSVVNPRPSPTATRQLPSPTPVVPSPIPSPSLTLAAPSPTPSASRTSVLPPLTASPIPAPSTLDTTDLASTVSWLLELVDRAEAAGVADLMGQQGVAVVPFGVGLHDQGYDNSEEIIAFLQGALGRSVPIAVGCSACIGCSPDKAYVFYRDFTPDWPTFNTVDSCEFTAFAFFATEGQWQLVAICCVPEGRYLDQMQLLPCSELP